jgi:Rad3-related DNA helicase
MEWAHQTFERGYRWAVANKMAGGGKSAAYVGLAQLYRREEPGFRACFVTATRALQEQLGRDYGVDRAPGCGLKVIMGRDNYKCSAYPKQTCRQAKDYCPRQQYCQAPKSEREDGLGGGSRIKRGREGEYCTYMVERERARLSPLVAMNYQYALKAGSGVGPFDLVVLDEAHLADEELTRHLSVVVSDGDMRRLGKAGLLSARNDWRACHLLGELREDIQAELMSERADEMYGGLSPETKESLGKVLEFCERAEDGDWIKRLVGGVGGGGGGGRGEEVEAVPVWPGPWNSGLWLGAPRVLATSATVYEKTMSMLGVPKEKYRIRFFEQPYELGKRCPIVWVPTVKLSGEDRDEEKIRKSVVRIDQILDGRAARLGRNGLIHSVSWTRAEQIKRLSRHRDRIIVPDRRCVREEVSRFKCLPNQGWVLCGPVFVAGVDLPGDECRFVIVPKVPFGVTTDELAAERKRRDRDWPVYCVAQDLPQMALRGMRAEEDWCEVFILDDHIKWVTAAARGIGVVPEWFDWKQSLVVPKPLIIG